MSNWRDKILNEFVPALGKTIVVADPDRLLTNPQLYEALSDKGFELLFYEDQIALRFVYETRYRNRLAAEQKSDLIVVLHGAKTCLLTLPCHLLARSSKDCF